MRDLQDGCTENPWLWVCEAIADSTDIGLAVGTIFSRYSSPATTSHLPSHKIRSGPRSSRDIGRMADDRTLEIGIVGAGIGGVMAAIAISRAGANVTILEAASQLGEIGAGIQMVSIPACACGQRSWLTERRLPMSRAYSCDTEWIRTSAAIWYASRS